MKELIDRYSKGKIEIKFNLAVPVTSAWKRNAISICIVLPFFLLIFFALNTLDNYGIQYVIAMFPVIAILLILLDLITKRTLFKTKKVGLIKFLEEKLEIWNINEIILTIPYSEIKGIRYQASMPRGMFSKRDFKAVVIEIFLYNKSPLALNVESEMFLTEEDQKIHRSLEPHISIVLESIKTKYGTHREKVRTPVIEVK